MDMMERVNVDLRQPLTDVLELTGGGFKLHNIPVVREALDQMAVAMKAQAPEVKDVTMEDRKIPGPEGAPEVAVRIYRPENKPGKYPVLLWIHGGGYVVGTMDQDDPMCKNIAKTCECSVVSVEYRLAPEHPFPAPLEDCYAALKWIAGNGSDAGFDTDCIAVGGASAGGGLAAGLALMARDRAEVGIAFQLLIYPMIDDTNIEQAADNVPDTLIWTRENNLIGWRSYLGQEPGGDDVSPHAAAFRADNLTGLPPAYIAVGDLDLFLDENVGYALRLIRAEVPVELHVYPGGYHGFNNFAPLVAISRRFNEDALDALKRALHL